MGIPGCAARRPDPYLGGTVVSRRFVPPFQSSVEFPMRLPESGCRNPRLAHRRQQAFRCMDVVEGCLNHSARRLQTFSGSSVKGVPEQVGKRYLVALESGGKHRFLPKRQSGIGSSVVEMGCAARNPSQGPFRVPEPPPERGAPFYMRRKRVRDEYEMPVMFPLTPPGAISFWSLHFQNLLPEFSLNNNIFGSPSQLEWVGPGTWENQGNRSLEIGGTRIRICSSRFSTCQRVCGKVLLNTVIVGPDRIYCFFK